MISRRTERLLAAIAARIGMIAIAIALAAMTSCTLPATEAIIEINSDAPPSRTLHVH